MNSKKAVKALLVCALALLSLPALAARGFDYSYADVGYFYVNGEDYDMNSGQVDMSFGVQKYVALRLGYIRGRTNGFPEDKDPSGDPDVNEFRAGLEPHFKLAKSLDLYADAMVFTTKFNGDRSSTDTGGIYGAGLRYRVFKRLELRVGGEYVGGDTNKGFGVLAPVVNTRG